MYKSSKSKHRRPDKKSKEPSEELNYDESAGKWYRSYIDRDGKQRSEWVVDERIPRAGGDGLQDLTLGVDNLSVSSGEHYGTNQAYDYPVAPSVPETEDLSSSPTYTHSHAQSSAKGKASVYTSDNYDQYPNTYAGSTGASIDPGYGTAQPYSRSTTAQHGGAVPAYEQNPNTTTESAPSVEPTWGYREAPDPRAKDVHPVDPAWGYRDSAQSGSYAPSGQDYAGYDTSTPSRHSTTDITDDYDQRLHETLQRSKEQYYNPSGGEEPSSAYGSSSAYATPSSYGSGYEYDHEPAREDPDASTPRAGSPVYVPTSSSKDHITGTVGSFEELDPRYRVEPSARFQPGEVFKILWSEPMGQGPGRDIDAHISDIRELQHLDQRFYVGFRRFIVVANDEGHGTCVPILTYERKGCAKKGVKANRHGMIYTSSHKPSPLKNEPILGYPPVRMRISAEGEKLAKESRINYSKLVTIEHNVKVFFIGSISNDDWYQVQEAVNDCWEKKMHHSRKKHK